MSRYSGRDVLVRAANRRGTGIVLYSPTEGKIMSHRPGILSLITATAFC